MAPVSDFFLWLFSSVPAGLAGLSTFVDVVSLLHELFGPVFPFPLFIVPFESGSLWFTCFLVQSCEECPQGLLFFKSRRFCAAFLFRLPFSPFDFPGHFFFL